MSLWERFWFAEIPPHIYAALRIAFGFLALASLLGVRDLHAFWDVDGFVPGGPHGAKALLARAGLGHIAGRALFLFVLACYASMTIGFRSSVSVGLSLLASVLQQFWNRLPLSGANMVVQAVLFCLVWADCGSVWSLDAWRDRARGLRVVEPDRVRYPIAPLRLIRFQVALIYLNSGLWKLFNEHWRDGTAIHYVVSSNVFRRFPYQLPSNITWLIALLTYAVLFWEIAFPAMVLYRPTRRIALAIGVAMHLGMTAAIEIGPFGWVMIASYIAFLDPKEVRDFPARARARFTGIRKFLGLPKRTDVEPRPASSPANLRH